MLLGLSTLVVGVLLLVWPDKTLTTLAVIIGVYLLLLGVLWICLSLQASESRGAILLRGALALLAGVIVIRHPSGSLTVMALAVGICLLLAGILELVASFDRTERSLWRVVPGLISLAVGIVVVSWPQFGIVSFAVVLGIALVLRGTAESLLAVVGMVALRREHRAESDLTPPG